MLLEFGQAMIFFNNYALFIVLLRAIYARSIEHMAVHSQRHQETPKLKIKMFITETVNNNNYTKSELSAEENMYTIMTVFLQWTNDKLL